MSSESAPSAQDHLRSLIDTYVKPELKQADFRKQGQKFVRSKGAGMQLITVQKSSTSTADLAVFTVNLGVWSRTLANFFTGSSDPPRSLGPEGCDLRTRLPHLLYGEDVWWKLPRSDEAMADVGDEVRDAVVSSALPFLDRYSDDRNLRDLWRSGNSPGLTATGRFLSLSVLLAIYGPRTELEPCLRELELVLSDEQRMQEHTSKLRSLGES